MEKARIVNLTPHEIVLISHRSFTNKGMKPEVILRFPTSGTIARCSLKTSLKKQIEFKGVTIDITDVKTGRIYNLPKPKPGTYYIVSKLIAEHAKGRGDLLVCHGIYKKNNKTIGARSFTLW